MILKKQMIKQLETKSKLSFAFQKLMTHFEFNHKLKGGFVCLAGCSFVLK